MSESIEESGVTYDSDHEFLRPSVAPTDPNAEHSNQVTESRYVIDENEMGTPTRRALNKATLGLVPVITERERELQELTGRIEAPVCTHHRIAVLSLKGGIGKSTVTICLGSVLASLRGDKCIAVDANPDMGTLVKRVRLETKKTVGHLLAEKDKITRYADIRAFTSRNKERLEVIVSDSDLKRRTQYNAQDHKNVSSLLETHYNIVLNDCGTGIMHPTMPAVLDAADQVVIVTGPAIDEAYLGSQTIDWLQTNGYPDLARKAIVVMNAVLPESGKLLNLEELNKHFITKSRGLITIPWDEHLALGGVITMRKMSKATKRALMELAASVADGIADESMRGVR